MMSAMTTSPHLFPVPARIEPSLARLLTYWQELRRGGNDVPFSDDVDLAALPDVAAEVMLIDAVGAPPRFRLAIVGRTIADRYGGETAGRFLDEMAARNPIDDIVAQCRATVATRAPSYFRRDPATAAKAGTGTAYARLLLPLWGSGEVNMLLGGIA